MGCYYMRKERKSKLLAAYADFNSTDSGSSSTAITEGIQISRCACYLNNGDS